LVHKGKNGNVEEEPPGGKTDSRGSIFQLSLPFPLLLFLTKIEPKHPIRTRSHCLIGSNNEQRVGVMIKSKT
jgi:hypothetical protein